MSTFSLVYSLFLATTIIFNLTGNSLVCILILKKKAMKTSINRLLFHLAIADLLVAVFFIPPCILAFFFEHPSGVIGDMLCKFITSGVLGWMAASASSFLLVAIAFERYNATLHPLEQLSRGRSSWLVPILWILATFLVIPLLVATSYDTEKEICVRNFLHDTHYYTYSLIWSSSNALLPISIMGYLYTRIILCLRNRVLVPGRSPNSVSHSRNKVTKMLISVSVIFITCWTPAAVLCVLSPVIPSGHVIGYYFIKASALLNSCLNPLVYTLHSQQFRKNVALLMSCYKTK